MDSFEVEIGGPFRGSIARFIRPWSRVASGQTPAHRPNHRSPMKYCTGRAIVAFIVATSRAARLLRPLSRYGHISGFSGRPECKYQTIRTRIGALKIRPFFVRNK
jgi:hypothetical protein